MIFTGGINFYKMRLDRIVDKVEILPLNKARGTSSSHLEWRLEVWEPNLGGEAGMIKK